MKPKRHSTSPITQAKNHGIGFFALNDVQLVEAREAYPLLEPFGNLWPAPTPAIEMVCF
jgi:hypothetical protein